MKATNRSSGLASLGICLLLANIFIVLTRLERLDLEPDHNDGLAMPGRTTTRMLVGIMSMESDSELVVRNQFREQFSIMTRHDDTRLCGLSVFEKAPEQHRDCRIVYTFVLGGNPCASPELVNASRTILVENHTMHRREENLSILNIQENMEQGKSQTWLYYAQQLVRKYGFDYVAKSDSDSIWNIPMMLDFLGTHLPPKPYNQGILAGKPCDKLWWRNWRQSPIRYEPAEKQAKEGYLRERYGDMGRWQLIFHLYALGQFYVMSADLVDTVVEEASTGRHGTYIEDIEDHDVSTMAFHSAKPVHFILLSKMDMQFWEHGIKISNRQKWKEAWEKAKVRLSNYYLTTRH